MKAPTLSDVKDAAKRIDNHVTLTPLRLSHYLSEIAGREVRLKMETMQDTGAFKLRGATNALLSLPEGLRARGVVTMSSGNHGRGLAFASKNLGIPCTVYMSELVPSVKIDAIRALGADVVIAGPSQEIADVAVLEHVERDGVTYVHAFDQPDIIAGQGTLGLEILEDMPDTASVLIPLSGGGLFAGVAMAMKSLNPNIHTVGITMENGPAMIDSLKAGHPVPVNEVKSLADALGGTIGLQNELSFDMTKRYIDETALVSEDEIADAMRTLFLKDQVVAEGGGAVGVAALLSGRLDLPDGPVAIIISGCNIEMTKFMEIVSAPPKI
jgi:threonine dehydratase